MKALRTWETETNTYIMVRNNPYGYRIEKMDKKGNPIDFRMGATEYSLAYWFEHKDFRREEDKNF